MTTNPTDSQQERRKNVRKERPTRAEVRAVFHRIWTGQVGQANYNKRDWRELRTMIFLLTGLEL